MIEFQLPNLVRQSLPVTPIEQGLLGSAVITSLFYSSSLGVAFGASYAAYKVYQTALADRNAISFKDSNIERSTQLIAETLQSPQSTEIDLSQIPHLSLPEAQKIEELAKKSDYTSPKPRNFSMGISVHQKNSRRLSWEGSFRNL